MSVVRETEALAGEVEARIKTLRTSATDETRKRMTAEAQELRARKLLATHQQTVFDDIERRKKYAAYGCASRKPTTPSKHRHDDSDELVVPTICDSKRRIY